MHFEQMKTCAQRTGLRFFTGSAHFQLSRLAHYSGQHAESLAHLEQARAIFAATGQEMRMADVYRQRAEFLMELDRLQEAEADLDAAEALYGRRIWVRESGGVHLLRLELLLRTDPGAVTEAHLDAVRTARSDAPWQGGLANALLAIGFALDEDLRSARHYARETLAQLRQIDDIHFNDRILRLAQKLGGLSAAMRDLASYWADTLALPEAPRTFEGTSNGNHATT